MAQALTLLTPDEALESRQFVYATKPGGMTKPSRTFRKGEGTKESNKPQPVPPLKPIVYFSG